MKPAAGGQNTPQDAGRAGVVSGGRDAAQDDSAPVSAADPGWVDLWGYWHPSLWEAVKGDVRHLFGRP